MRFHQVVCDFGLAVDHHNFSIRMFGKIKPIQPAVKGEIDTLVDQTLAIHTFARFGFPQQIRHALFNHTSANPAEHIVAAATLDNDRVDPLQMEQSCKQQARWS